MMQIRKLVLLGSAIAALAATGSVADTGVASASAQPDSPRACAMNGPGICTNIQFDTPLWLRAGGSMPLFTGDQVEVTCWYFRNGGDGFWDHVTWESPYGNLVGHVDDEAVNFNGKTPNLAGLPEC